MTVADRPDAGRNASPERAQQGSGNGALKVASRARPEHDAIAAGDIDSMLLKAAPIPLNFQLEYPYRSAMENHVHRAPRLGECGLLNVRMQ
jgi:hypothetical protein